MSAKNILLKLLGCRLDDISNISEQAWAEIIDIANKQHVTAYLYYHLKEIEALGLIPAKSKDTLFQSFKQSTFRNMALMAEFKRITNAFMEKGIPVIGLKGLHLVSNIYPHIGLRFMRDLDILVPLDKMKVAYDCTTKLGYQCDKVITKQDFSAPHHHLYQQFHPDKNIILELHRSLTEEKNIDMDKLWENAKDKDNGFYFDTEDLLLHLCIHISYNDLFKIDIRHYLDINLILQNRTIDWEQFLNRVENTELTRGVLLVFDITSRLFGLRLPNEVESIIVRNKSHEESMKYAIEFMWKYDKSSKGYKQYKSKLFISDEPIVRRFFRRIFITKDELSFHYSLDSDSRKVYLYYFRRVYDLFSRHFVDTFRSKTNLRLIDNITKTKMLYAYLFDK
ncbi:hypothetical protein BN3087_560023 [Sulfurovum sp. enrichment culture clone C5]|uniref:Nucleotidyltransferase family protein n=1 Tax=Sulfurovum sp. enrichment culture clone C5 TaxID=497650 RepID=A0A0S4XQ02_9BACT|nr:hypothetical protein BN3087_560023 [Sulfurovum sp. enrichment culture clone C5]